MDTLLIVTLTVYIICVIAGYVASAIIRRKKEFRKFYADYRLIENPFDSNPFEGVKAQEYADCVTLLKELLHKASLPNPAIVMYDRRTVEVGFWLLKERYILFIDLVWLSTFPRHIRNAVLAHELGHYAVRHQFLHVVYWIVHMCFPGTRLTRAEIAADIFAAHMTSRGAVLSLLHCLPDCPEHIARRRAIERATL